MSDWRKEVPDLVSESVLHRGWVDARVRLGSLWFWVLEVFFGGFIAILVSPVAALTFVAALAAVVLITTVLTAPVRQRDDARRCLQEAEKSVREWCESHPRPIVTAEYVVPQWPYKEQPDQDVFIFRNDTDLVAFNVTPEIEGIPPDTWITWDDHKLVRLERGDAITLAPMVYKAASHGPDVDGISGSSIELEGTLYERLRSLVREPPYPDAWTLRIRYNDHGGRTYETECDIVVDSDLGGIVTRLCGKAGRLVDLSDKPSSIRRAPRLQRT